MVRGQLSFLALSIYVCAACGSSTPLAKGPSPVETASESSPTPAPEAEPEAKPEPDANQATTEETPEPTFTPEMSVEEAIKAIPQAAERVNVDQETLSKPLQDEALYAPCKPGAARFTLRVAVWRGKAVAIDLTTTPKNPKLAECLKGRIRELTWPAKVPSLNTVEYSL